MPDDRSPGIARADCSVLVVIDVQARLFPHMGDPERLARRAGALIAGARLLGVPILVTEQNPDGIGATVPQLAERLEGVQPIQKTTFSCFGADSFREALRATGATRLVLCGIEAHICVLQTGLDALAAGFDVTLAVDAIDARLPESREVAPARLASAGAALQTAEGVLFEWMERCDHPLFRDALTIVKEMS